MLAGTETSVAGRQAPLTPPRAAQDRRTTADGTTAVADSAGDSQSGADTAEPSPCVDADGFAQLSTDILAAMNTVIDGKQEAVRLALTVLLAGGHLLLEDVPGVGKTLLAKSLARAVDCSVNRIQFTPDLLPSDITGVSVFNQSTQTFVFRPGAIFANIVIGDEINRASAKTQSALLESMAEHQVTVDGTTYALQEPFMVVATQNPIEMEGTYPLPEAQRDRFTAVGHRGSRSNRRPSLRHAQGGGRSACFAGGARLHRGAGSGHPEQPGPAAGSQSASAAAFVAGSKSRGSLVWSGVCVAG